MKVRLTLLLVILGVLLTGNAFSQTMGYISLYDYNFIGDGARARAMGGAFLGVSDDATALSWNPAGLMQLVDPQVSLAMDYFSPKNTYSLNYADNSVRNLVDEVTDNKVPFSYASFTSPIRIMGHPFVASAMFSTLTYRFDNFVMNFDSDLELDGEPLDTAINHRENNDSRLNKFRLGFGTHLWKNLSFGTALDIYWGTGHYDQRDVYDYSFIDEEENQPVVINYVYGVADTVTYSGLNFVGSFMWDAEKFNLGLILKTPFYLSQEHVQHSNDTTWENGLIRVDPGLIDEQQKEDIQVPLSIGVGASYQINENFLLAGDIEWRRFGASKIRFHYDSILSNGDLEENYTEENLPMKNGYALRFGAEYKLNFDWAIMPVWAGFRYETFGWLEETGLQLDSTFEYIPGDQVTGYTLTCGTGFNWDLIKLSFAFEYAIRDRDLTGSDAFGSFTATSEYRGPKLIVNFTGLFK